MRLAPTDPLLALGKVIVLIGEGLMVIAGIALAVPFP